MGRQLISLGWRPRGSRRIRILGVRPNMGDYPAADRALIEEADKILYATPLYCQALKDAGKEVFPSPRHYHYHADKIRQKALFDAVGIPMPLTRIYYGQQADTVWNDFSLPFVAKTPRTSGQGSGVFLIRSRDDWTQYTPEAPCGVRAGVSGTGRRPAGGHCGRPSDHRVPPPANRG